MENMELLQAMRQMMEEVVSPIYERLDRMDERLDRMDERLDRMDERLDKMDERLEKVEVLATKTQLAIENDISPKIKLLFEGQMPLQNRFAQLDEMERILREVQSDVLVLKNIAFWHSRDIRMLKRRR